jgi:hypothetical protein
VSVRAELAAEPTLARSLVDVSPAALLAPRVSPPLAAEHAGGLDLILEGFLAHHGRPRHLATRIRGDLVLAGDYCYAAGLVRVAGAGDLFVIEALANLVALSAGLVADGRRDALPALWGATVAAIAAPRSPEITAALADATHTVRRDGDASELVAIAQPLGDLTDLEEALAA